MQIQQQQLPLVLFGSGLPILPGLAGEAKSYSERLFNFPDIGALSQKDAKEIHKTLLGESFKYKEEEVLLVHSKQDEQDNNNLVPSDRGRDCWCRDLYANPRVSAEGGGASR